MKTLILYASTYGYTTQCVQTLSGKLTGEVDSVNIGKKLAIDISMYDAVILGGSIYMGQIQKTIKEFCTKNMQELLTKKIGLFLCCGFADKFEEHLKNAFPKELIDKAEKTECFGGEINVEKLNFAHKMITKMVTKAAQKEGNASAAPSSEKFPQNIGALAETFNKTA